MNDERNSNLTCQLTTTVRSYFVCLRLLGHEYYSLTPIERDRGQRKSFYPSQFSSPLDPVLLEPHLSRHQNTFFPPFLPDSFSFFSFSASRIGSCRIHTHLVNDIVFNLIDESSSPYEGLKKERDFARRENQTLEKEIEELRKKSEDYERENQALRKEQQEMMRQLQRKDEELEEKVTNRTSEFEKMLAREQKLRKNAEDCLEKSLAETKAKDVLLENMSAENKHLQDESNAKRSKCDDLREEVRLNLRLSGEITGRKYFV